MTVARGRARRSAAAGRASLLLSLLLVGAWLCALGAPRGRRATVRSRAGSDYPPPRRTITGRELQPDAHLRLGLPLRLPQRVRRAHAAGHGRLSARPLHDGRDGGGPRRALPAVPHLQPQRVPHALDRRAAHPAERGGAAARALPRRHDRTRAVPRRLQPPAQPGPAAVAERAADALGGRHLRHVRGGRGVQPGGRRALHAREPGRRGGRGPRGGLLPPVGQTHPLRQGAVRLCAVLRGRRHAAPLPAARAAHAAPVRRGRLQCSTPLHVQPQLGAAAAAGRSGPAPRAGAPCEHTGAHRPHVRGRRAAVPPLPLQRPRCDADAALQRVSGQFAGGHHASLRDRLRGGAAARAGRGGVGRRRLCGARAARPPRRDARLQLHLCVGRVRAALRGRERRGVRRDGSRVPAGGLCAHGGVVRAHLRGRAVPHRPRPPDAHELSAAVHRQRPVFEVPPLPPAVPRAGLPPRLRPECGGLPLLPATTARRALRRWTLRCPLRQHDDEPAVLDWVSVVFVATCSESGV
ncbi:membrane-bound acid phosphatase precursor [Strigomonas culicis]|uniref:Membrane-bound acid phosphatase n=1 Tax=Strigomonas culicis TaxID=28005 RepID=S9V1I2_9TRYP|nr:membrane-bound acid phosphatase precursor [Strigomonas culicis]|eukprot:EPY36952.1 membrane-bound acid phosphatase precursor [Strigomonas culicis]